MDRLRLSRPRGKESPSPGTPRVGCRCNLGDLGVRPCRVGGPPRRCQGACQMMPVEIVLDRLEGVKERGEGYQALCPAHDDHDPSLSISEGEDGRALIKCFSGCETEEVVAELGLEMKDLFERRNGHGGGGSFTSPKTTSTDQRATLENYAAYIGLPVA